MKRMTFGRAARMGLLSTNTAARYAAPWDPVASFIDPEFDMLTEREELALKARAVPKYDADRAVTDWSY